MNQYKFLKHFFGSQYTVHYIQNINYTYMYNDECQCIPSFLYNRHVTLTIDMVTRSKLSQFLEFLHKAFLGLSHELELNQSACHINSQHGYTLLYRHCINILVWGREVHLVFCLFLGSFKAHDYTILSRACLTMLLQNMTILWKHKSVNSFLILTDE